MLSKNVRNIILNTSVALSIVLTSAVVPAYFNQAFTVAEASTTSIMKATANVNMRTGAGAGYAIILTIPEGAQVTLVSSANGWSKVTYNGKTGYASNTYLAAVTATAPTTTSAMKTTANVNMRTGAGTGYAVILTIPEGAQVTLLSSANGWAKLTYNGKTGYASSTYLAAVTATVPAPTAPTTVSVTKTTSNLNMRSGAGTGYGILMTIPSGKEVKVNSTSNGWTNVSYGGKTGYVSSTYLKTTTVSAPVTTPTPTPTPPPAPAETVSVTKTTVNLNMRSGAGTFYGILLTIPSGTQVKVNSTTSGWTNVSYGGKTGYVSSAYLKTTTVSAPIPTPTPTPTPIPTPPPAPAETVSVTKTNVNVNMRSGAGTGYGILLTIPSGTEVKVNSTTSGWTNVSYGGKTGYVSSQYLTTTNVPVTPPTTPPAPTETVPVTKTNANVNMRSGAGTGYGIILTIPSGTEVKVNSTANGWTNVTYGGKTGYVTSQYLTTISEVPPTVPVEVKLPSVLVLEDIKTAYDNVDVKINGYSVSDSGVNALTVTLDGRDIPVTRGQRTDLSSLYSNYTNLDNIGFSFSVGKASLSVGKHTMVVKATSNDGTTKTNTYSFQMTKPAPAISISGVTDGQDVPTGTIAFTGFAVNIDGVASVKYYVNGSAKTDLLYGKASSATGGYSAYTGYRNANFTFSVNSALLVKPINSIKVELTGTDGTVYEKSVILRGAGSENYVAESYGNSLDYYVGLESAKSSLTKGAQTSNTIKNYMDPANYIYDDANKYIFMDLSYEEGNYNVTAEDLNKFLVGKGVLADQGAAYLEAANTYKVNPYYLIAHSILETGRGTSVLSKGQYVTDTYTRFGDKSSIVVGGVPVEDRTKLVYNVFGIGAWDSDPNLWGKQKAYTEKWFTVADAIKGGAKWISTNYTNRLNYNQNTLYKMRYNIAEGNNHEYATDLGWAVKQAARIKTQLDTMGIKPESLKFIYPKFK